MSGMTVFIIVVIAAPILFALAWWSSGRAGRAPARNAQGDAGQDAARMQANLNKTQRGANDGGGGTGFSL